MILLIGIPSEPPLAMVADALRRLGFPFAMVNQRRAAQHAISVVYGPNGVDGVLTLGGREIALSTVVGVYDRSTDPSILPEMAGLDEGDPEAQRALRFQFLLSTYLQTCSATVINRLRPMGTNASKPSQAQVVRSFLPVPETLVTNDPATGRQFVEETCGPNGAVYKSISGERSIVMEVGPEDLDRLDHMDGCPVQFQRRIAGVDCRVHVIGSAVHACLIETDALDYRYAQSKGHASPTLTPVQMPPDWADACRCLTQALGLEFAGIDLVIDADCTPWCLEVNTSPAYSYFDVAPGHPIATAVARHLAGIGYSHDILHSSVSGPVPGEPGSTRPP